MSAKESQTDESKQVVELNENLPEIIAYILQEYERLGETKEWFARRDWVTHDEHPWRNASTAFVREVLYHTDSLLYSGSTDSSYFSPLTYEVGENTVWIPETEHLPTTKNKAGRESFDVPPYTVGTLSKPVEAIFSYYTEQVFHYPSSRFIIGEVMPQWGENIGKKVTPHGMLYMCFLKRDIALAENIYRGYPEWEKFADYLLSSYSDSSDEEIEVKLYSAHIACAIRNIQKYGTEIYTE